WHCVCRSRGGYEVQRESRLLRHGVYGRHHLRNTGRGHPLYRQPFGANRDSGLGLFRADNNFANHRPSRGRFQGRLGAHGRGQPGFHEDCGIKEFGGAFTDFAKKSFRLYFRSDYGASKLNYPVFDGYDRGLACVDEFNQLELRSGSHDMSQRGFYMSNIFTDDTLLEMGRLNPHGRFVHLYFNGAYWGLYHLRERWDAAMHQSYLGGARTNRSEERRVGKEW